MSFSKNIEDNRLAELVRRFKNIDNSNKVMIKKWLESHFPPNEISSRILEKMKGDDVIVFRLHYRVTTSRVTFYFFFLDIKKNQEILSEAIAVPRPYVRFDFWNSFKSIFGFSLEERSSDDLGGYSQVSTTG